MHLLASGAGHKPAEFTLATADFIGQCAGDRPLVKVLFYLPLDWYNHASESLWAEWAGENHVRLLNAPFFTKGVSRFDVIAVRRDDGWLTMDRIIVRSGHSTVRLLLHTDVPEPRLERALHALEQQGCTFAETVVNKQRLLALDIQPHADFDAVHDGLERGERDGLWQYEEGHCGHHVS